jgi:hypothetical protein
LNSVFSMFSVIFIVMIFMAICSVFVIGFRKK